jgi:hypothetical protein
LHCLARQEASMKKDTKQKLQPLTGDQLSAVVGGWHRPPRKAGSTRPN